MCYTAPVGSAKAGKNNMKQVYTDKLATSPLLVEWGIEALFLICQLLL